MPCEIPRYLWDVEVMLMQGRQLVSNDRAPDMRRGVFGTFKMVQGPFHVRFNDGTCLAFS